MVIHPFFGIHSDREPADLIIVGLQRTRGLTWSSSLLCVSLSKAVTTPLFPTDSSSL